MEDLTTGLIVAAATVVTACWAYACNVRRAVYQMDVGRGQTIQRLQEERTRLDKEIPTVQRKNVEIRSGRQRNQAIADALLARHAEGIRLLNRSIGDSAEYSVWKNDYRTFEKDVVSHMKQLGCSESEIHGVEHIGAVALVPTVSAYQRAAVNKSRLVAQLDHIAAVANSHDTTRPA